VIPGLIVSACALLVATGLGLVWQRRNGRVSRVSQVRSIGEVAAVSARPTASALTREDLGAALGNRATLVQFSSAFCAPCRATRRILTDVAEMVDGVAHVEIDAESRLDLVRRLDVRRTPTTIVLGPHGQVTHRASGQPRKADVIAALGAAL
jgi:thiol-disulfide isomerase/thioredoxin